MLRGRIEKKNEIEIKYGCQTGLVILSHFKTIRKHVLENYF